MFVMLKHKHCVSIVGIFSLISLSTYYYLSEWLHRSSDHFTYRGIEVLESEKYLTHLCSVVNNTNEKQTILNAEKFGPLQSQDHVFVVQTHNRTHYLKLLIDSLRNVSGINKTLLIFSHSLFDEEINKIVQSIEFAKVLQIFYPYSTQLYPTTFPGDDPNDCPRDMKKEEAIRIKCNNAEHPDTYGHYRESKYAQIKLHAFWKFNFVFDSLRVMRNHTGFVTFIEDDYFVFPDIVYVLNSLRNITSKSRKVGIISLGERDQNEDFSGKGGVIEIQKDFNFHFITITRRYWLKFKWCAKEFCLRDEYHWDVTFYFVITSCVKPPLRSLQISASRVYHIGDCGMHRKKANCFESFEKLTKLLKQSKSHLFPKRFKIVQSSREIRIKNQIPWGGFADPRDHSLCLSFVQD